MMALGGSIRRPFLSPRLLAIHSVAQVAKTFGDPTSEAESLGDLRYGDEDDDDDGVGRIDSAAFSFTASSRGPLRSASRQDFR
ncbi:hypothetical protein K227x_26890 [Rubripirellula lacrimiformis]|uniref:Uncharacterized protein n=1 Tax=Rubripirellula lacrimiformis TaxID=1930273 RepID=A0A517NAY5_9BACT|nr:hypothetical protein K227x_26890 [Rubripirellula lacrimiformis]